MKPPTARHDLCARMDLYWDGVYCRIPRELFGEVKDALRGPPIYESEAEQLTRPLRERIATLERTLATEKATADGWRRLDGAQLADVALNAARYCWLRSHPVFQAKELPNELELLDACIDRYMVGKETEE